MIIEIPHIDKAIISKLLNTCADFVTFKDALPEIAAIIKANISPNKNEPPIDIMIWFINGLADEKSAINAG